MKICVLIPVFNEARTIGHIVEEIKKKKLDVLVIDDGSTDKSGQIAKDKGAIVFTNSQKTGKGASLRKGFEYIIQQQDYDGVITMDGDGQHAVDDIEHFVSSSESEPISVIVGNRMANAKGMPWVRYLTNRCMSILISLACRQRIDDTQCGYRYVSCRILEKISFSTKDFEIETEVLMKSSKKGYPILSVPIKTIYEDEESKINPVTDTIRFVKFFLKEIFSKDKK